MILEFTIPGQPRPWKRVAIVRTAKGVRGVKTRSARAQATTIAAHALQARQRLSMLGRQWPRDERYHVWIEIVEKDGRRGDLDNLAKAILDAANGVLWDDDRQVDGLFVRRLPSDKANPRTMIRAMPVEP